MARNFIVMVDSGSRDEPEPRRFSSLDSALLAAEDWRKAWGPFIWIVEERDGEENVVHMKDGCEVAP